MKGKGGKRRESEQRGLGKGRREGGRDTPEKPLSMESGFSGCFWWKGVNALCMGLAGHQTFRVEGDLGAAKQDPCGLKRRGRRGRKRLFQTVIDRLLWESEHNAKPQVVGDGWGRKGWGWRANSSGH